MVTENPVSSSGCAVTTSTLGPCAQREVEINRIEMASNVESFFIKVDLYL
jgi:hypothetical protein